MRFVWTILCLVPLAAAQNAAGPGPLKLSLKRAVEIAASPEGSARVQLSAEALKQAESRSAEARAALLPNLDSSVSYQNQTRNLAAFGISLSLPIPGFTFPTMVGPYNVFDARATAQQSVFDFSSIRRFQAARVGVLAAKTDTENTAEQVAGQVARAYIAALKAQADVDAAQADLALAQAVLKQAENQKAAGTGTGIEITRARVQLSNQRQRLLVAGNAVRSTRLQLLRAIGLRMDVEFELTDRLEFMPVDAVTLEQARAKALETRPDLKVQREREANTRLSASATRMERLPSVAAFADYGAIGTGIDRSSPTRTYGISIKVPVFDGGRRDARRAESVSQYRAEKTRTHDLQQQVELDVRLALDSLNSAAEQVTVAKDGLELAGSELTQARRRYDAGVTNSLEVTDAQTRLERARENQIAALFNYNLARIDLAQAMGAIRRSLQ
jgi:outer membrane protein